MTAADWGATAVTKAREFRDATAIVELGAGDFSRSIALAERYPAKRFLSTDYEFSAKANGNLPVIEATPNLDVRTLDARTIDVPAGSVDFMFSIALMEHIAELDQCLAAAYRALRPGGVYFYIQAPFWTCAQGHHFRHSDDRTYEFIPKYSHLTHGRDELADLLRAGPEPPFDIEACVDMIYSRPDLSRLGLLATKSIVDAGPLELVRWDQKHDRRYDADAARAAYPSLRVAAQFDELAVSGAEVVLRRPIPGARRVLGVASRGINRVVRRVRTAARNRRR